MKFQPISLREFQQAPRKRREKLEVCPIEESVPQGGTEVPQIFEEYMGHYARPREDIWTWFEIQRLRRMVARSKRQTSASFDDQTGLKSPIMPEDSGIISASSVRQIP